MGFKADIMASCLIFTFILNNIHVNAQFEVEDESSFSYVVGAWNGPENWGKLNPSWNLCGNGKRQSPVNIVGAENAIEPVKESIRKHYKSAPAKIRNRGHDIQVEWEGNAGGIIINGNEYRIHDCHWHIPSEHIVNGTRFAMELHIVHERSGEIAVVSVLYKYGSPNHFLERLSPYLKSVSHDKEAEVGKVNPLDINFRNTGYYRYMGSLTTPPCSQNVKWTVIQKVETVSKAQVKELQNAVHDTSVGNARPIQPLNERAIHRY